jgi:hypothetical protein
VDGLVAIFVEESEADWPAGCAVLENDDRRGINVVKKMSGGIELFGPDQSGTFEGKPAKESVTCWKWVNCVAKWVESRLGISQEDKLPGELLTHCESDAKI